MVAGIPGLHGQHVLSRVGWVTKTVLERVIIQSHITEAETVREDQLVRNRVTKAVVQVKQRDWWNIAFEQCLIHMGMCIIPCLNSFGPIIKFGK